MGSTHPGPAPAVRYLAELSDVPEVGLWGTADLAFWGEALGRVGFTPIEVQGSAQVWIMSLESRFRGVGFREFVVAIPVCRGFEEGYFLSHAYNSSRLFTLCERLLFKTPYSLGVPELRIELPASLRLTVGGIVIFEASMGPEKGWPGRKPRRSGDEDWEGKIFLPRDRARSDREVCWFGARLGGFTHTYDFLAESTG